MYGEVTKLYVRLYKYITISMRLLERRESVEPKNEIKWGMISKFPREYYSENFCQTLESFSLDFDGYVGLALRKSMGAGQCKESNKRHS